jgi:hypothetical protein
VDIAPANAKAPTRRGADQRRTCFASPSLIGGLVAHASPLGCRPEPFEQRRIEADGDDLPRAAARFRRAVLLGFSCVGAEERI